MVRIEAEERRDVQDRIGHVRALALTLVGWIIMILTAYSATKGGLQRFSEALRRELADTPISVSYVAPRAVRTPINFIYK